MPSDVNDGGEAQNRADIARPRTVLVAGSNTETRNSLEQVLGAAGWKVLSAADAESVLRLAGDLPDAVVLSLSERMELLERAQAARTEAVEANRAKSEFLATMSHELRTPLNAVLGYSQLLDMGVLGPVTESQHEHLDRLRSSSVHLLTLVNDVLDLSKVDAGRMHVAAEAGSFHEVAEGALGLVRPQAVARNITLVNECTDAGESTYVGDADRVRQILANLLSNSIKFTDPGGRVNVTCGTSADVPPNMEMEGPGPCAFASVRDTGMGISPDDSERMFEPFVQGESGHTRERGGTGLGLAISRRFARLMHGDISVESARGHGSNFTLWLPAPAHLSEVGRDVDDSAAARGEAAGARPLPRYDTIGDIPIPAGAAADEMEALGRAFAANADAMTTNYVGALREQGIVPRGHDITDTHLRNHAGTLFADFAAALTTLGALRDRASALLRDGSELQRTIAELHGVQRHRLGWSEHAVMRDAEVMSREVLKALESLAPNENERGAGYHYAAELLRALTARAAANSLRAHRGAAAADAK